MAPRETAKRRHALAELLISNGSVQTIELARQFHVSRETIRKDLIYLEKEGIGKKERGGSFLINTPVEQPLSARSSENISAKKAIALAALKFLPDEGTVLLDSGSTVFELARHFKARSGFRIMTNSAQIPALLASSTNSVFSLGGELRRSSMAYVGMWTLNTLDTIRADIAFIGIDGLLHRNGPCTSVYSEAEIKKAMVRNSCQSIILCDSSKFAKESVVQFCDWGDIDYVITDSNASADQIEELNQKTKVIVAEI